MIQITAVGQEHGWIAARPPEDTHAPYYGSSGRLSVSVLGNLAAGTVLQLQRRLRAEINGGTPGTAFPMPLLINAALISANAGTGHSDDIFGLNAAYEYNIVCTQFWTGDTVYVEMV